MQYRFGKIDYYGTDGLKKTIPSIIHLGNASKYGIFFWSEVNHIDLEYAEEIVSSIEMLLRGEVDFYEGFGFEVYMIECDRECIRRRQGRSYYSYRRGLRTDERLAGFST